MRESALPTPGAGSKSQHLRRISAASISALEVTAGRYTGARHPAAAGLKAFFDACSAAAAELDKITPTLTFTATPATVAVGQTRNTTLGKGGSGGAATYTTSNAAVATVNGSGVVTGVAAGTVTITASVAGTSTYRPRSITLAITVTP